MILIAHHHSMVYALRKTDFWQGTIWAKPIMMVVSTRHCDILYVIYRDRRNLTWSPLASPCPKFPRHRSSSSNSDKQNTSKLQAWFSIELERFLSGINRSDCGSSLTTRFSLTWQRYLDTGLGDTTLNDGWDSEEDEQIIGIADIGVWLRVEWTNKWSYNE